MQERDHYGESIYIIVMFIVTNIVMIGMYEFLHFELKLLTLIVTDIFDQLIQSFENLSAVHTTNYLGKSPL